MNLVESIKKVLKTKSQIIFTRLWKEDLLIIFKELGEDLIGFARVGKTSLSSLKGSGIKAGALKIINTGPDVIKVFKVLPKRIKLGFLNFKDDFLIELDKLPSQKEKTVFCMKVMGALVSMSLPSFYKAKKTKRGFSIDGLKNKSAFIQFVIAQLGFKISQLIIFRFLEAVEEELTSPSDLENIRYFKMLITGGTKNYSKLEEIESPQEGDPSFRILENLKHFIMTGEA